MHGEYMEMKKYLIPIAMCILLLGLIAALYAASTGDIALTKAGKLIAQQSQLTKEKEENISRHGGRQEVKDWAIKGEDFIFTKAELDNLTAQNMANGASTRAQATQLAMNQLIVKRSIYYYAVSKGYSMTDDEVQRLIDTQKSEMKKASNYSDFETFLKASGFSEDEYWQSQFEIVRLNEVIGKFQKSTKSAFLAANKLQASGAEIQNARFKEYYADVIKFAVERQNIQLDKDISWTFSSDDRFVQALCE